MSDVKSVFVQVVEKPQRKVMIKRGKTAKEYWKYCKEVGCDGSSPEIVMFKRWN